MAGSHEVRGSIPLRSTKFSSRIRKGSAFLFFTLAAGTLGTDYTPKNLPYRALAFFWATWENAEFSQFRSLSAKIRVRPIW